MSVHRLGRPLSSLLLRHHQLPTTRPLATAASVVREGGIGGMCGVRAGMKKTRPTVAMSLPWLREEVARFDSSLPVEKAYTPPASWFTEPSFHELELDSIFRSNYVPVGGLHQVPEPGKYFTGRLGNVSYLVVRDEEGVLRAFHNVCRHHAMCLLTSEQGMLNKSQIECPYHGWTYRLDGRLTKATRITGIKDFKPKDYGLIEIPLQIWGPLIFLKVGGESARASPGPFSSSADFSFLDPLLHQLDQLKFSQGMRHVHSRTYTINCNWKVVVDNYLDGGMHVPYAHKGLGGALELDSYETTVHEGYSTQVCSGNRKANRVGQVAVYAHIYPNLMVNRYGPWLDTNIVIPRSANQCDVVFDYFLDDDLMSSTEPGQLKKFIEDSLKSSGVVQDEDTYLCENVQRGLESPSYDVGRYAPQVEFADHDFHVRLARQLHDYLSHFPEHGHDYYQN